MTVLKEFYVWVAPIARFKVSENTIYLAWDDVECEIHLIPLDDEDDQRRLLSMQLTGCWINEFPEVDPGLMPAIAGRVGRYPSKAMGGPSWYGVIADGNFPTEGGEWCELLEYNTPPDWDVWKQPGGLTAKAENVENLPGGREYYERLSRGHSRDWVRRFVDAEYGADPSGTAVYRESFRMSWHVRDIVEPVMGHPLIVGQDFGRDPWAIVTQLDHRGRLLVLEEIPATDIGLELHIRLGLRPALARDRYMGRSVAVVGDPAGASRDSLYEETSFDLLKRAGFQAFPAPTNDLDPRIRAVESFLIGAVDAGPQILISKQGCPTLVRGFAGGYRFAHTRRGQRNPVPDKSNGDYSHIHDALQYAALATHGGLAPVIMNRLRRRVVGVQPRVSAAGWT